MPFMPAFAAEYATCPGFPALHTEVTLTITPFFAASTIRRTVHAVT